jgi:hypothetical protein
MRSNLLTHALVALLAAATTDAASLQQRAACDKLTPGSGPKASPDTAAAFLALPAISDAARSAGTPWGYVQQFSNLQAAKSLPTGYLGFTHLTSYDVNLCAVKCNAIGGCTSINLYYERDPALDPGDGNSGCADPASTTNIKCVFWKGTVTSENANNQGQYRNKFQVVIAGSDGYTNALALVGQASYDIVNYSAQPYCSSILGYTTPVVTTTVMAPFTLRTTTTATNTATSIFTNMLTAPTTRTVMNTAHIVTTITLPVTNFETKTASATLTIVYPTTKIVSQTTTASTVTLSFPTTVTTTITQASRQTSIVPLSRRGIVAPTILSKYPASVVTSACLLVASPATVTTTVTSFSNSTVTTVYETQTKSTTISTIKTASIPTTIDTTLSVTEVVTATTKPVVTVTTTTVATQTQIDNPTTTITSIFSDVATVSTTPTSTVTAIHTPPACSITSYKLQIVGGTYDGQYMTDADPADISRVVYSFVYAAPGLSTAHAWTIRSDNRVYEYPKAFALSILKGNGQATFNSLLSSPDARIAANNLQYVSCTVRPSTAVAGVPGSAGLFTCNRPDGTPTTFFTVPCLGRLPNGIYEGADLALSNASLGCPGIPLTIAAIPISSTPC